jgi:transporter family protein
MNQWILYTVLALVSWGIWGLFPKLSLQYLSPNSAIFYEALGAAVCGISIAILAGGKPEFSPRGSLFAFVTGATAILGAWFYLYAARNTNISTVAVVTAMYPVITVVLAWAVLGESMTHRQLLAMLLALGAIVLVATEQTIPRDAQPLATQQS